MPAALQSCHLGGSEFGVGSDLLVPLLGVFAASAGGEYRRGSAGPGR